MLLLLLSITESKSCDSNIGDKLKSCLKDYKMEKITICTMYYRQQHHLMEIWVREQVTGAELYFLAGSLWEKSLT